MKSAGLLKKIDQFGRIVLPKSLRKDYDMNEGDPIEILAEGHTIILEKFRPKCVFCNDTAASVLFKEKYLCAECSIDIVKRNK